MSSLHGSQPRRQFLAGAAAVAGAILLTDCGGSPTAPEDDPEPAGKQAGGAQVPASVRVYEAVHITVLRPASPLDALELSRVPARVREYGGQPLVSAVNGRVGIWV
ncbi:MAG: hypothetical protein U1C18_01375, partial [Patescibacteria group bacterium]|nr:hypothetical protein [Patescibacteria group bacterium]